MKAGRVADGALALLRLLPAESSHGLTLTLLRWLQRSGVLALLAPSSLPPSPRSLMGLEFPNPLGLAAGLDKDAACLDALSALGPGFIEVGTVTPRPCAGNSGRRLRRLRSQRALVNRLGFPSLGADRVATRLERFRRRNDRQILGANIGKHPETAAADAAADYRQCMERLWPLCDYLAINLSSPNSPGLRDLQQAEPLRSLLAELAEQADSLRTQHRLDRPLVVKLSPDLKQAEIEEIAEVLRQAPVAGVILTNTTLAHPQSAAGGLSGPPLAPLARQSLQQFHSLLPAEMVRIACGGIDSGEEAFARHRLGANLFQLYTGLIYRGPSLLHEIASALSAAPEQQQNRPD